MAVLRNLPKMTHGQQFDLVGKVLKKSELKLLVSSEGKTCLSYLTGIFALLCSLNKELQGSDKNT